MSIPELKLSLIERITRTDDPLLLRTLHEVMFGEPEGYLNANQVQEESVRYAAQADRSDAADQHHNLVADDTILGRRPDGTSVTAGEAVRDWDADVAEVLAGGGVSAEEVYQRWTRRAQ